MTKQTAITHAIHLWVTEDRPYWKYIRGEVVNEALLALYGALPRA